MTRPQDRTRRRLLAGALGVSALLLAGCGGSGYQGPTVLGAWNLASVTTNDGAAAVPEGAYLRFSKSNVEVPEGCNDFRGSYRAETERKGTINITGSNKMCDWKERGHQEVFRGLWHYVLGDTTLTLRRPEGKGKLVLHRFPGDE